MKTSYLQVRGDGAHYCVTPLCAVVVTPALTLCRVDDDGRVGVGRCWQEDLLDRHWNQPY